MKKVYNTASIVMSIIAVTYFAAMIVIAKNNADLSFSYSSSPVWIVLMLVIPIAHGVLTVASQSKLANILSLFALIPYIALSQFYLFFGILLIIYWVIVYALHKCLTVKIVCITLAAPLILACGILTFFFATGDSGSWSSLIENVSEDNYVSPERSHNAKLTVYYYTDDEYYNKEKSNSYGFTVNVCDLAVINAGPIVFDSNYRSIQSKDLFEEQPNISVKWIDDDTIEINGQKFNVNR